MRGPDASMVWVSFAIGVIACAAFSYAPGFLFLLGLGFNRLRALVLAPVVSLAGYCVVGIALAKAGMFCSWLSVGFPVWFVCLVTFVIGVAHRRGASNMEPTVGSWSTLLLFVLVGIVVGIYVYVSPLASPDAFLQEYDDAFHMTVIRAFVESGSWSVLDVSKYLTAADRLIEPMPSTYFYPALWHIMCAMIASAFGCSVAFAMNVFDFTIVSLVFPLGIMLMTSTLFEDRITVRFAAVAVLGFAGFPWFLLYWGTLYANVLGFALAPLAICLFIRCFDALLEHDLGIKDIFAFIVSLIVLAVAQTSAVFMCVVLLAPYCVYRIWTKEGGFTFFGRSISSRAVAGLFILFVLAVWTVLVFSPFMRGVVEYDWAPTMGVGQAMFEVAELKVMWLPAQLVLALLVLVGIICTLRHRAHLWISIAYAIFFIDCVLCASTAGFLKHYLAGFWYTDLARVLACLVFPGIPLAALGLTAIGDYLGKHFKGSALKAWSGVLLAVFCVVNYFPNITLGGFEMSSAIGDMREEYRWGTQHYGNTLYSDEEQAFVREAIEAIPEGSVVINVPNDGSIYAYAVDGLRTYYRDYQDYDSLGVAQDGRDSIETEQSKLIRKYGAWYVSNENVRAAIEASGARYILLLDQGGDLTAQDKGVVTYRLSLWTGLSSITDDTPGFEVVLSDGDMRLYEIVGLNED